MLKWIVFVLMLIASAMVNYAIGIKGIGQVVVVGLLWGYLIGTVMARVDWDSEET